MSNTRQQPVYLFAGGRGRTILTTFARVCQVIKNSGRKRPLVAFVGVASLKDNWLVYALLACAIKMGCDCRIKRVAIAHPRADLHKAKAILQKADVVFVSGGDVDVGMQVLREKGMVDFFQSLASSGKLFIGVSAGSIILSRDWVLWRDPADDSSVELLPCLGIVPLICDTHDEKDDWVELKTALRLKGHGIAGYGITSGAHLKVYSDGRIEAESGPVVCYANLNGQIESRSDLTPKPSSSQT
jgi:peptidase E